MSGSTCICVYVQQLNLLLLPRVTPIDVEHLLMSLLVAYSSDTEHTGDLAGARQAALCLKCISLVMIT